MFNSEAASEFYSCCLWPKRVRWAVELRDTSRNGEAFPTLTLSRTILHYSELHRICTDFPRGFPNSELDPNLAPKGILPELNCSICSMCVVSTSPRHNQQRLLGTLLRRKAPIHMNAESRRSFACCVPQFLAAHPPSSPESPSGSCQPVADNERQSFSNGQGAARLGKPRRLLWLHFALAWHRRVQSHRQQVTITA